MLWNGTFGRLGRLFESHHFPVDVDAQKLVAQDEAVAGLAVFFVS
jgi:hypothetical protein